MYKYQIKAKVLISFVFISTIISCSPRQGQIEDPSRRLSEYISKSFSVKGIEDKNELISYLTGEAKVRLGNWSEDQFREAFIDSKRQFKKLSIREVKPISPQHKVITYELTFSDWGKGINHETKVTQKKLCDMVLEKGRWMIESVQNMKELIEYKNELSLP
jgi:hypothetical protein